jgi:filamentous hemagglutinin family protein
VQVAQSARYTFSGTAGEVVSASTLDGTFDGNGDATIVILNSSGGSISSSQSAGVSGLLSEITLPSTETYSIDVNVNHIEKGSVKLYLAKDATGSIVANGSPVTFTSVQVAQSARYTFSGTAGEVVSASTLDGTFAGSCPATIVFLNSSGGSISASTCASPSGKLSDITLPSTETYSIDVNVNHIEKGSLKLSLTK